MLTLPLVDSSSGQLQEVLSKAGSSVVRLQDLLAARAARLNLHLSQVQVPNLRGVCARQGLRWTHVLALQLHEGCVSVLDHVAPGQSTVGSNGQRWQGAY